MVDLLTPDSHSHIDLEKQDEPTLDEIRSLQSDQLEGQRISSRGEPSIKRQYKQGVQDTKDELNGDEVLQALAVGTIADVMGRIDLEPLRQSLLGIESTVRNIHNKGMQQAQTELEPFRGGLETFIDSTRARDWIENKTATFANNIVQETRQALRETIARLQAQDINGQEALNQIKQTIGLTRRQARAIDNFRQMIENQNPEAVNRFLTGAEQQQVRSMVENGAEDDEINELVVAYADHQENIRADRMAVQETRDAWNNGKLNQAFGTAMFTEVALQTIKKVWITAQDDRVCPFCAPLHGETIAISKEFQSDVERKTEPGFRTMRSVTPPLHPNGRCTIVMVVE